MYFFFTFIWHYTGVIANRIREEGSKNRDCISSETKEAKLSMCSCNDLLEKRKLFEILH